AGPTSAKRGSAVVQSDSSSAGKPAASSSLRVSAALTLIVALLRPRAAGPAPNSMVSPCNPRNHSTARPTVYAHAPTPLAADAPGCYRTVRGAHRRAARHLEPRSPAHAPRAPLRAPPG